MGESVFVEINVSSARSFGESMLGGVNEVVVSWRRTEERCGQVVVKTWKVAAIAGFVQCSAINGAMGMERLESRTVAVTGTKPTEPEARSTNGQLPISGLIGFPNHFFGSLLPLRLSHPYTEEYNNSFPMGKLHG